MSENATMARAIAAQVRNHVLGVGVGDRSEAQGRIVEQLGRDPAHTEQHRGAELWVAVKAENQLDAIADQFLNQKPFKGVRALG